MVIVNDVPEPPMSPAEIMEWRRERKLTKQLREALKDRNIALNDWLADRSNKEKVRIFNEMSLEVTKIQEKLSKL